MTEITYRVGDATAPAAEGNRIIAYVCNDIGGWGKGFVLALSRRWPQPESDFRAWYAGRDQNDFGLGAVRFVQVEPEVWVANMVGQHGLRRSGGKPPIRYEAIEAALATVARQATALVASVHMPRIGCGLAGGTWGEVEPIVRRTLSAPGIETFVYDLP